jgi:hypothetical protein
MAYKWQRITEHYSCGHTRVYRVKPTNFELTVGFPESDEYTEEKVCPDCYAKQILRESRRRAVIETMREIARELKNSR